MSGRPPATGVPMWVFALTSALAACRVQIDQGGPFACAEGTCPAGYVCNADEQCVVEPPAGNGIGPDGSALPADGGALPADGGALPDDGGALPDDGGGSAADAAPGTSTTLSFGERSDADVTGVARDTFIVEWGQGLNAGVEDDVHFAGGAGDHEVGLLRFDLRAIPDGAIVTAAELRVHSEDQTSTLDAGNEVRVHVVLEPWDAGAAELTAGVANWTQRSTGVSWTASGAGAPGSRASTPVAALAWTVSRQERTIALPTAVVQAWVDDDAANYGLAFVTSQTDNPDYGYFLSSDHADPTKRPLLVVTILTSP